MFTDRDTRATYDEESAVRIELNGSSISVSSDSVQINGTTAILTEEATYIVSGTLDDGMLVVDADEAAKLQIVLDNASITSSTSAALYVLEADKVFVTASPRARRTRWPTAGALSPSTTATSTARSIPSRTSPSTAPGR